MNWIEINGYFLNLDNLAFVTRNQDTKTTFGFIGGQSMDLVISYEDTKEAIKKHHEERGIK